MHLYLHPTLPEALSLEVLNLERLRCVLTRWSLATSPATPLLQRSLYHDELMYQENGQPFFCSGGLSALLFDGSFALVHVDPHEHFVDPYRYRHEPILEMCRWHDLSTVGRIPFPIDGPTCSPACSPDGRWIVANRYWCLFLFDRLSGEMMSSHPAGQDHITALAFDATSRFVAVVISNEGGGDLSLWKLDSTQHFIPHSGKRLKFAPDLPVDDVRGPVALSRLHSELSRELSPDISRSLRNSVGYVAFSPDSRMVVFSLDALGPKQLLVAYEVASGKLLWITSQQNSLIPFVFAPSGNLLVTGNMNGELACYRGCDGSLLRRVSTGFGHPIEALAFDHDATSLWLASEGTPLVRYPLPLDLLEPDLTLT